MIAQNVWQKIKQEWREMGSILHIGWIVSILNFLMFGVVGMNETVALEIQCGQITLYQMFRLGSSFVLIGLFPTLFLFMGFVLLDGMYQSFKEHVESTKNFTSAVLEIVSHIGFVSLVLFCAVVGIAFLALVVFVLGYIISLFLCL